MTNKLIARLMHLVEDTGMYGGFYKDELNIINGILNSIKEHPCLEYKSLITNGIELELDKEKCGYGARFTVFCEITNEDYRGNGLYHVWVKLHNFMPNQMPYEIKEILSDFLVPRSQDTYYVVNKDVQSLNGVVKESADIINSLLNKISKVSVTDEFLPYQVMNKDTGDVWEFDNLRDAKRKEAIEREKDFYADIRTAKVNRAGELQKWV